MQDSSWDLEKFFTLSLGMLCIADMDGRFRRLNPAFERTLGWKTGELLGRTFLDFVHPDDHRATMAEMERLATGAAVLSFECRFRLAGGGYKHLLWTASPDVDTALVYAIARDITARKRAEERFRLVIEASPNATLILDSQGRIVLVNEASERLFGYDRSELLGQPVDILVPETLRARHRAQREAYSRAPVARRLGEGRDLLARCKDGTEIPVEIGLNPIETDEGTLVFSSVIDLSARKEAERQILELAERLEEANERLSQLASADELTGLKNRRSFNQDLDRHLLLASRSGRPLSLVLVDIDHFKPYNDRFGHLAGDEILRKVADILARLARRTDFVCRIGGEEFAIGLPDTDQQGGALLGERFRAAIETHIWPRRQITVSLGVSTLEVDTGAIDPVRLRQGLLELADQALYRSKQEGRNRVTVQTEAARLG